MKNKGFTVIELLASFTLTMIIVVFLFEIVLQLKDIYINNTLKTKVLNQNAVFATELNNELKSCTSAHSDCTCSNTSANECSNNNICKLECGRTYYDVTIDPKNNEIKFNAKVFKLPEDVSITNVSFEETYEPILINNTTIDNSYIRISYNVTGNYLNEPIKFNYIHTFHNDGGTMANVNIFES